MGRKGAVVPIKSPFAQAQGIFSSTTNSNLSYLAEPPSYSSLPDASLVVSFKNLLKKDPTTKTKALEDIVSYVQAHPHEDGGVDESVLETWVQLYPRTSIDNARRVRELSHTLQFELMKSARKRMERYIPKIVAVWLAGLYDRDRVVARAAHEGLSSFLTTPEKTALFWKKCQRQILEYAIDAIQETKDTLSDERSTTPDDAEAKYLRVVAASLLLVAGLVHKLGDDDENDDTALVAVQDQLDEFLAKDSVWESVANNDMMVRKASCQLLQVCLAKNVSALESQTKRLKKVFVVDGLKASQTGSALDFVLALTALTTKTPSMWISSSDDAGSKKNRGPLGRLVGFIERGSQGTAASYWTKLSGLVAVVPREAVTPETAASILSAMRTGLSTREEPKAHAAHAWPCYLATANHFLSIIPADSKTALVTDSILPLFTQYLYPTPEMARWSVHSSSALDLLAQAYTTSHSCAPDATTAELDRLAQTMCAKLTNSLPEVSKEFEKSQDVVAEQGKRWFGLLVKVSALSLSQAQSSLSGTIMSQCISLLRDRNYKPYGAAMVIAHAGQLMPQSWTDGGKDVDVAEFLRQVATTSDLLMALQSPSGPHLLKCVDVLSFDEAAYNPTWEAWVDSALQIESPDNQQPQDNVPLLKALTSLISNPAASSLAQANSCLQSFLISASTTAAITVHQTPAAASKESWTLFEAALKYDALSSDSQQKLVTQIANDLRHDIQNHLGAVHGLALVARYVPEALMLDKNTHTTVLALMLRLAEIDNDEVRSHVAAIQSALDSQTTKSFVLFGIVKRNLEICDSQSLEIDTLVQQALGALKSESCSLQDLLPSIHAWETALDTVFTNPIDLSLALTRDIGGAYLLVKAPANPKPIPRDRQGWSLPARVGVYLAKLIQAGIEFPDAIRDEYLNLFLLVAELARDQLTNHNKHGLCPDPAVPGVAEAMQSILDAADSMLDASVANSKSQSCYTPDSVGARLISRLVGGAAELTPSGLYHANTLVRTLQRLNAVDTSPPRSVGEMDKWLATFDIWKATPTTVFASMAILAAFADDEGGLLQESKIVSNLCNRLVSDVAGFSQAYTLLSEGEEEYNKTLVSLVLLGSCLRVYEETSSSSSEIPDLPTTACNLPVAHNRLVFAVKQITQWTTTATDTLSFELQTEICLVLQRLLICIKDVYGPYWSQTLDFCEQIWAGVATARTLEVAALPALVASINLVKVLESLEDPNDDLVEALGEFAEKKSITLLEVLKTPRDNWASTTTLALQKLDSVLARESSQIPPRHITDLAGLYELVASDSPAIQELAVELLRRGIPAEQEQRGIDVLLDKSGNEARLPDELVSLLMDAPTLDAYSEDELAGFPHSVRTYLLAWLLVFDTLGAASFKLRADYAAHLKAESCLDPLLNFLVDVLGHSVGHALKLEAEGLATAEQICHFVVGDTTQSSNRRHPEHTMQHLLVHLYYNVLRYLSGLFKTWMLAERSKQTRLAVHAWTEKYFSPVIVSETLDEIAAWAASSSASAAQAQAGDEDEKDLVVKVSRAAREVTAGYEVDEDMASIVVKIPADYPISGVLVEGVHRVAVSESKWQAWLMATRGVITFSNGSIVDGLSAFRGNIVGALRGQSECAICYSIISTDKKMPDKKCQTCRNAFHRTCLYKWFQTSSQNSCPLCRNPIDYLGAEGKSRR